jgi:hypothetical protein
MNKLVDAGAWLWLLYRFVSLGYMFILVIEKKYTYHGCKMLHDD